ncbi:MAG: tetratricopeptide repeat protein, partial [Deltaproteobacteria bacterium]|nr:tetratricopeptide repeat protein [Deltaproteobacteria bacterium]
MNKKILTAICVINILMFNCRLYAQTEDIDNNVSDSNKNGDPKELYNKGVSLFEQEKYEEAAAAFNAAFELKPSWKLLYNIGQAEAASKNYGKALQAFENYLIKGGDEIIEERRSYVLSEIKRIRPLVGWLEITAPDNSIIIVDGMETGKTPLVDPLILTATTHKIVIKHNDIEIYNNSLKISGENTRKITVKDNKTEIANNEIEDTKKPSTEETPVISTSSDVKKMSGLKISAIITGITGIAAAGLGTAFTIKGTRDWDEYNKVASYDKSRYDDLKNDIIPLDKAMALTGFIAAGVLIATSATLFIIDSKKNKKSKKVSVKASGWGFAVT